MLALSLILFPFLLSHVLINAEALRYGTQQIEPLTEMVLNHQIQEQAGSEEG